MSNLVLSADDVKRLGDFFESNTENNSEEKKKNSNYYVYALCNNGIPFYVGKGIGTRCLSHEEGQKKELASALNEAFESALKEYGDKIKKMDKDKKVLFEEKLKEELTIEVTEKYKEIGIAKDNEAFNIIIVKFGLTEHEAFMVESAVINALSFCGIKLTNAVNGHSSKKEKETGTPTKARYLDELLRDCCPPVVSLAEIDEFLNRSGFFNKAEDEITFISYNNSYQYCKTDIDIWDAVRGCWYYMSEDNGKRTKYIFAMHKNIIKNIFKVKKDGGFADFQKVFSADHNLAEIKDSNLYFIRKGDMATIEKAMELIKKDPSLKGNEKKLAEITGKEPSAYNRGFFACDINDFDGDKDLKLLREAFCHKCIKNITIPRQSYTYLSNQLIK